VGGVIEEEENLLLQTPESLHDRFRLDVRINSEVISIDRANKSVKVKNLISGAMSDVAYDKLVLSPGASPIVPPLPGIERGLTLRTVEDVERMVIQVAAKPTSAVVIGGGFIGVEIAENLVHRGIKTSVVEASDQVLAPLDPEMASLVAIEMTSHGVDLHLGVSASAIGEKTVTLSNGVELDAELVMMRV
jgi:NADPH-dependent 2,4-dienoyl-CoA reductase/sulfur reductase-like enzyme